jgi:uncharacterized protein YbjQ (UPF0145 family)
MGMKRLAILGAAGIIFAASSGAWGQTGAPLIVYAAGEITPDRYTVVRRLWVDGWRSAFEIPRYSQSGAAIGAIVSAAARSGADGVVNLHCVNDRRGTAGQDAFLCYALAIKRK